MKAMTFEEFKKYSYNYVEQDADCTTLTANSLIEFVMQHPDKWLYIENSLYFLFHVMGLEVCLKDKRVVFYQDNKTLFPEISCGDYLVSINGMHPLEDGVTMSYLHCRNIHLLIETPDLNLNNVEIKLPIVEFKQNTGIALQDVGNDVGYIKINTFSPFDDAKLTDFLHQKSRLIIDLRECGGGPINHMLKFCEYFAPEGDLELAVVDYAGKKHHKKIQRRAMLSSLNSIDFWVSSITASSAEIFCLLLRKKYSGVIIGSKTAGKLVIQEHIDVDGKILAMPIYKVDLCNLGIVDGMIKFSGTSIVPDIIYPMEGYN